MGMWQAPCQSFFSGLTSSFTRDFACSSFWEFRLFLGCFLVGVGGLLEPEGPADPGRRSFGKSWSGGEHEASHVQSGDL